ncbi:hypothetical protein [Janthinobacterium sp. TND4EL3]|uniref:hypothetical protein n=1 Tax=Pseudomonadota TaxID=1224 RepID=UPI0011157FE2|nr:hypothetical protein [Janthinobacterium sp. TND4EL3]
MEFAQKYPGYTADNRSINTPVEAGVIPLCDALNSLPGVFTIWSCEGHPERASRPFVTFVAPKELAFKVHRAIEERGQDLGLNFNWWLTANFRDDGSMQYTIEPNDYRVSKGAWQRWWSSRRWSHRVMLKDLSRLATLVQQGSN